MSTTDPRLGTVLRDEDRCGLRFVRTFPHPQETVWAALTESRHLRHWFPADLVGERRPGSALRLPFWPEHVARYAIADAVVDGTVQAWDPPSRASWTWGGDLLVFELEEADDGTRLTFTTWLAPTSAEDVTGTAAGYHVCLDLLEALLAGRPQPPGGAPAEVAVATRARYRDAVG
ncbi:SRPBCC domain-containing protein [Cellulomonas dongxiuzhuiae]|uniref:SRPBCC domain-containing protein n=1 Tax=Cellulomonas dongxiuzhuiae TaxID=2819979 RepID=A0ABX8GG54_9CELL|nr:SRPBCC domain-containing protein [Cellulomonas dongxiuzhuiae]MBO3086862.1 SRPBCC domain-containing protein [Cellulomonas dongxiuzhuiae]MBO3093786.1 SRPBCC domain-containing protein [Cellulomonas dongxiuzhuiae]QWC14890.1 SRPBCC domain-containing protein [Cellulomonas dongxiuzhuiae]